MKNSKFGNVKTVVDGIKFDSKKEADRYLELRMLERAGEISDLEMQKRFELIPKQDGEKACYYYADFDYYDNRTLQRVTEDTKGVRTPEYVIKRKLMLYVHGIRIVEL